MKIGFDAKRLYCNFTGLGNYSRAVLRDLAEFHPEPTYHLYTPRIQVVPETQHFLTNSAYQTYQYAGQFEWLWRSRNIINQLVSDQIDLYHGLSHELPINIQQSRVKSIVTIHDLIFEIYPKTYSRLDRQIYHWKFKHACQAADKIVAISESTKQDIIRYYGIDAAKIEVIYQSCHPLFYEDPVDADRSALARYQLPSEYLLYVGSITPRKNLEIVIGAYEHLLPDERLPWVVVGYGPKHRKKLEELIRAQPINIPIIWIDDLTDNRTLRSLYQHASALVYPSLYEGFGLPVVEALLSRTPVITSATSSLPEAGGPNSMYVDPQQPHEVAEAIQRALTDTELRNKMKQEGYQYATKMFSRQVTSQLMSNLYKGTVLTC